LYSRGFGALPIATAGAVWYLLLLFFVVSTIVVALVIQDPHDFRLVVGAGIWGGVWSLSSYFVSRSHPVNLLSLLPVLLFAVAILLIVVKGAGRPVWNPVVRVGIIPVFAIPVALTIGHPGLAGNLRTPQLPLARFTDQLPLMDEELETALREAGGSPADPVVRIADGRLLLPAWRGPGASRLMSERSWLPKPYEIIGTLSPERRQVYIDRNGAKRAAGWLIQHDTDTVKWFGDHLAQITRTHAPTRKLKRGLWSVWWMEPRTH
ncbi:MAG TPA: hypothetical protein VHM24_11230, partial [Gemmatimonadaceae bacterium]|nr:hypothetical protein [Gemmatimonadaceae bacterium]